MSGSHPRVWSVDHLLLLDRGRVRLAGPLPELLDAHRLLEPMATGAEHAGEVVERWGSGAAESTLVRLPSAPTAADGEPPPLEELVLA